jgi:hypothetical protein
MYLIYNNPLPIQFVCAIFTGSQKADFHIPLGYLGLGDRGIAPVQGEFRFQTLKNS